MMEGFEIWFYRGIIAIVLIVLFFLFQNWIKRIDQRFDELISAINGHNELMAKQVVEVDNLTSRVDSLDKRLFDHSKRLRNMERVHASCINYKSKKSA